MFTPRLEPTDGIAGNDCSTDVPGLYAAGDTATRELSGSWAGRGAADFALGRRVRGRASSGVGGAGLRPHGPVGLDPSAVTAAVHRHVLPHENNFVRHADHLRPALESLHDIWAAVRSSLGAAGEDLFRAREAASMAAQARWMYPAALQRTETRGMHKRADRPVQDPTQQHRLLSGGLDDLWTRPERVRAATGGRAA